MPPPRPMGRRQCEADVRCWCTARRSCTIAQSLVISSNLWHSCATHGAGRACRDTPAPSRPTTVPKRARARNCLASAISHGQFPYPTRALGTGRRKTPEDALGQPVGTS